MAQAVLVGTGGRGFAHATKRRYLEGSAGGGRGRCEPARTALRVVIGAALWLCLIPAVSSGQNPVGSSCSTGDDCATNNCIDGVCCDLSCLGTCRSCAEVKTGLPNGTCGSVLDGQQTMNGCQTQGMVCSKIGCVSSQCFDQVKDGDETDVDCGGSCPGCDIAHACSKNDDCLAGNCVDGLCCGTLCFQTCRSCARAKTGLEDGTCAPVSDGQQTSNGCNAPGQVCSSAGCVAAHCFNQVKDADESDVDCGGSCPLCDIAHGCNTNNDCALNNCIDGLCCGLSCIGTCRSCSQAKTGEADGTCGAVLSGQQSTSGCDAAGEACSSAGCIPSHCFDQTQDNDETAVDCGGSCVGCDVAQTCGGNQDCASSNCVDGICCDASCFGTCHSCAQSITGLENGTCAQVPTGGQTSNGCKAPGDLCNDLGECENPTATTPTATALVETPTPINTSPGAATETPTPEPTGAASPTGAVPSATPTIAGDIPTATATAEVTPAVSTETPTPTATAEVTPAAPTSTPTATEIRTPTSTPTPTQPPCSLVGDCDTSNSVSIDELLEGVSIALGTLDPGMCLAFNCNGTGEVTIECLVQGVGSSLHPCPSGARARVVP